MCKDGKNIIKSKLVLNRKVIYELTKICSLVFLYFFVLQFLYASTSVIALKKLPLHILSTSLKIVYSLVLLMPFLWLLVRPTHIKKVFPNILQIVKKMLSKYWSQYLVYLWLMPRLQNKVILNDSIDLSGYYIDVLGISIYLEKSNFSVFFIECF